jgi:two-component system nitrogen regulation sensor histidine kinase NtrY
VTPGGAALGIAAVIVLVGWWRTWRALAESRTALETIADALGANASGEAAVRPSAEGWHSPTVRRAIESARRQGELVANERAAAAESSTHLRRLLRSLDAVVFTIDEQGTITYVNRRASALARSGISLLGQPVRATVLADLIDARPVLEDNLSYLRELRSTPAVSLWQVFVSRIDAGGRRETLVAATDISTATRARENRAFAQLTRVLSHEINNSLAPIASIADSVARRLDRAGASLEDDSARLLRAVSARATHLAGFVGRFGQAMNVPAPQRAPHSLAEIIRAVTFVQPDTIVEVHGGPDSMVSVDEGQLEQVLINLLANAAFASLEQGEKRVEVRWAHEHSASGIPDHVVLDIDDRGRGVAGTDNLFVPFFSTRKGGSGIGLFLSRRLVENNGGTLELGNRHDGGGARARVRLPLVVGEPG